LSEAKLFIIHELFTKPLNTLKQQLTKLQLPLKQIFICKHSLLTTDKTLRAWRSNGGLSGAN